MTLLKGCEQMEEYMLSRPHERARPKLRIYDLMTETLDITEIYRMERLSGINIKFDYSKYTKVIAPTRQYDDQPPYQSIHYRPMQFDSKGIARKFAKLKTDEDKILDFAEHHGFLGIKFTSDLNPYDNNNDPLFLINPYSDIHFEPIEVWKWHIKHVGRLLNLYNALDRYINQDEHYIDELLAFGDPQHSGNGVNVYWRDGMIRTNTRISHIKYLKNGYIDYQEAAEQVLVNSIVSMLDGALNYDPVKVQVSSAKLGFKIRREPRTPYLLATIYYDLCRMIEEEEEVRLCAVCGEPIPEERRRDAEVCPNYRCKKKHNREECKKLRRELLNFGIDSESESVNELRSLLEQAKNKEESVNG